MTNKSQFIIAIFLIIILFLLYGYSHLNLNGRINSLDAKITESINHKKDIAQNQPKAISEVISGEEKIVKALTDEKVKEEIKSLDNYKNWQIYRSKMDIKFRYPKDLGCKGSYLWEIQETSEQISIYDCNRFTGTFADTPAYEIRKITIQENSDRAEENLENPYGNEADDGTKFIRNEFFGILYADTEGYRGSNKYLPNEIKTSGNGEHIYFKFVLHKFDDYPIAVGKIIESVRLTVDTREY